MIKPIIFSWCSEPSHPGWARMLESCKSWGWTNDPHIAPWAGDMALNAVFLSRLDKWRAEGYSHALKLDAFDMVCVGPPHCLRVALAEHDEPEVLMSAEAGCWPGNYRLADYPPRKHQWHYAHSPLTVDLAQRPEEILGKMTERGYGTDQYFLADLILDGEPGVAIDRDQHVVMSAAHCNPWSDGFEIAEGRVRNKITGAWGLFVHGNGRTPIDWVPPRKPVCGVY